MNVMKTLVLLILLCSGSAVLCSCFESNAQPSESPKQVEERIRRDNRTYEQLKEREEKIEVNLSGSSEDEDFRQVELEKVRRVAKETRVYELLVESVSIEVAIGLMRRGLSGISYQDLKDAMKKDPKIKSQLEVRREEIAGMTDQELEEELIRQVIRNTKAKETEHDFFR